MSKANKYSLRFVAFFLCLVIIFLDTSKLSVLATDTATTMPISNEEIAEALSNAQIIYDEDSDDSEEESDVNWDELGNIQSDYDYFSELYAQAVANEPMALSVDLPGDDMVYLTQRWLNQEYGEVSGFGSVTENGKTGWDTIYGLTRALQYELGITSLANNFGSQSQAAYQNNILKRQDGVTNNMFAILQGALWCKGYSPGYNFDYNSITGTVTIDAVFDETVEKAVIEMKTDAGLINPDGVVTVNTMKALLSMDAFKLLKSYGGKEVIRTMQQKFNREYEGYIGLMPCDGVYGRSTNKAVIYVLQAIEGMPVSVATGNFGNTTKLCCPDIPYTRNSTAARSYPGTSEGSVYSDSQISDFIELLQFGLYINGIGNGTINGVFDTTTQQNVTAFQKKFALPITGKADITTWLSLFVSYGDKSRPAQACDCATKLTNATAKTLYDNGYRYVGRYLTNVPGGLDKAITLEEAQIIIDAGLRFFPIYQTSANKESYFTAEQGVSDAMAAIEAARKLGVPNGTIIYFAVDFDATDVNITNSILPYFAKVHETMEKNIYKTGVYGVRNVCSRVSDKGYAYTSFVSNLSSGFSGNLGFAMPENWAFDQFATVNVGSGDGQINIDKDGCSGLDEGVKELDPTISAYVKITAGNTDSDTVTGPTVDVLGHQVPLFSFNANFTFPENLTVESEFDAEKGEISVLVGLDLYEYSWQKYGIREKPEGAKRRQAYTEVKSMVSSIGKNDQVFKNRYQSLKESCIFDKGAEFGLDSDITVVGYMAIGVVNNKLVLKEGEIAVIGQVYQSWVYPIVSAVVFRIEVSGTVEAGLKTTFRETGETVLNGTIGFNPKFGLGVGVDAIIAGVYVGGTGTLDCQLEIPVTSLEQSLEMEFNAAGYFEYNVLKWGERYEWTFFRYPIYPYKSSAQTISISEENLKLIEPCSIEEVATISDYDVFKSNIQLYAKPQIISLDNGKMFMAYIDDAADRTSENSSVLMYTEYNGSCWSQPQRVLDNLTADFEPSICSDGNGGVHILWQDATSVFDEGVTLEEMSEKIELSYIHWNGSSFDEQISITTDNNNLEMNHKIVSYGENVSVVWKQNSDNDVFGLTGTNSIYRKQFSLNAWNSTELIASNLSVVPTIDTSYVNGNNVIAYVSKSGTDTTTIDDLEVYYINNNQTIQVTNNNVADYSAYFLEDDIYWIRDNAIISAPCENINSETTVINSLGMNVSEIKVIENSLGNKAIVWECEDDTGMVFYSSTYNLQTGYFDTAKPIEKKYGVVRGWDACLNDNGKVEMTYCYGEYQTNTRSNTISYGALNLIQKTSSEIYDISVDAIVTYEDEPISNNEISLFATLYNNGSKPLTQFEVIIFDTDGNQYSSTVLNKELEIGETGNLEIPFIVPNEITTSNFRVVITPLDGDDASLTDNEAMFSIGYADMIIENVIEEHLDNGRKLVVTVSNQGSNDISSATLTLFNENKYGEILDTKTISQLNSGSSVDYTFYINENLLDSSESEDPRPFYLLLESEIQENEYSNNMKSLEIYPDYLVSLSAGVGGSVAGDGIYANDSYASISAIPSLGYQFEGWYEDGTLITGLPQICNLAVNRNRTLEARFKKSNLTISNVLISGELKTGKIIGLTAETNGGMLPYLWSFYVYYNGSLIFSKLDSPENALNYKPEKEGNYTFDIKVRDDSGNTATYEKTIRIKSLYKITVDKPLYLSEKIPDGLKISYWSSSDTRVASVDSNGMVTGKRVGSTTITATTSSGVKLSWEVEVGFTWWQIFLIFIGVGAIMLPFWVAP